MNYVFRKVIKDREGHVVMTINKRFEKVEDKIRYENFYERKLQKLSNEEIHVIRDYARISEKKKN